MSDNVQTPRRQYSRSNICVLCGFSFIQRELTASGETIEKKLFTQKLKLSTERKSLIARVIDSFSIEDELVKDNGVCVRCYRKVENFMKFGKEREQLKAQLTNSWANVQSMIFTPKKQRHVIEKRLLRSPAMNLPSSKQLKTFTVTTNIQIKPLVKLLTYDELAEQSKPSLPPVPFPLSESYIPGVVPLSQPSESVVFRSSPVRATTGREGAVTTGNTRRTLGFLDTSSNKENKLPCSGEVEVNIYYPSGKKSTLIVTDQYKTICKAFVDHSENTDKIIVQCMCSKNPSVLMSGASQLIKEDCSKISKRGSGTILRMKRLEDFQKFSWTVFHTELELHYPHLLTAVSAIVSNVPPSIPSKPFYHVMLTSAVGLHGRSLEMSVVQYLAGFVLTHGGCTLRDIERLSKIGLSVSPQSIQKKLLSWQDQLDKVLLDVKAKWEDGGNVRYQLVGDNWDKNILPSYRTADHKTQSLHLFNIYAILDRVIVGREQQEPGSIEDPPAPTFIPSVQEQSMLSKELTFLFATSVIKNHPQMSQCFSKIYPVHYDHNYSKFAGIKTEQFPLGLFDCNENKTQEMIQLLKKLSNSYVPLKDGEIIEPVFLGGDRLTDERVQSAQMALGNANTRKERLEGFISKIEDFHRLMNFLEAIHKLTYSTESGQDPGTMYYYKNLIDKRDVKTNVRNSYRAYKMLYFIVLDAIILVMFMDLFNVKSVEEKITLPDGFEQSSNERKIDWLNTICQGLVDQWFFDCTEDIVENLRDILENPQHDENYWISTMEDGRLKCHFCDKSYMYVGSLKSHESKTHNVKLDSKSATKKKSKKKGTDKTHDYFLMLFKLAMLYKNLDTAVDMGDGERSVRSAKYELPIYHKTNKTKYTIGSIHLTTLVSGLLPEDQKERLIANRFVNVQGGKNNNIALDEYLEMLNRDSKIACQGHQTKESIIKHSKAYPLLVELTNHFEEICEIRPRKGFHHLPSYKKDVETVVKDMLKYDVLNNDEKVMKFQGFKVDKNPFENCAKGLPIMVQRHKPHVPFHRLRDPHV